jgi:cyclopropane-fatty-acyl-phospholipid synthase
MTLETPWPADSNPLADIAKTPISKSRAPAASQAIFRALRGLRGGALTMYLPGSRMEKFGDGFGPHVDMYVKDYRFARRVLFSGDIGFAEGWIAGEWHSPDVEGVLTLLVNNSEHIRRYISGGVLGRALNWLSHMQRANTRSGSRRNILAHYDLGNAFYGAWLDPSMTYSAARYTRADQTLEQAQAEKYRALARALDLQRGEHVLEIGCGWGGFAEIAAREFGARVTALTISDEQFAYASARIEQAGSTDQVEIRLQDYRDVTGRFDKIVSIEMFEAVGEAYWPAFFRKMDNCLRLGGRAALQVITIRDDLFPNYRRRADFIQACIFPGGMLPSIAALKAEAASAGFQVESVNLFGQDYAATLKAWTTSFAENWDRIQSLGFDDRFRRLWLFYLGYCAAGFRSERTNVAHICFVK